MHHKEFITQLDERRIETAIAEAEKQSSGEIRVYISHKERHDAMEFARKRFQELGMFKTRERNAVLIYIVPRTQQFAVLGDNGIHEKCGDAFWQQVVAGMQERFKNAQFTDAIVQAVQEVGTALQRHFPRRGDDTNELPNQVARD
jgi:uncharacterized membrane protein